MPVAITQDATQRSDFRDIRDNRVIVRVGTIRTICPVPAKFVLLAIVFCTLSCRFASAERVSGEWIAQHFQRAKEAQDRNDPATAVREYQTIISQTQGIAEVYANLGMVYHQQKKYDLAIHTLRTAIRLKPDLLGAQLFLGIDEYLTQDFTPAREHLTKALQLKPSDRQAGLYLALTELALDESLAASRVLRQVAKLYPDDPEISYQLGESYLETMRERLETLKSTGDQSPFEHCALAIAAGWKNDLAGEAEEFVKALMLDPNNAEVYRKLTPILGRVGLYELAEDSSRRYRQLNPFDQTVLSKSGELTEAPLAMARSEELGILLALWKQVPSVDPEQVRPAIADVSVNQALKEELASANGHHLRTPLESFQRGDYHQTVQDLARMRVLRSTSWAAAYLMTSAYVHTGNYDAAEEELQEHLMTQLRKPPVALIALEIESHLALVSFDAVVNQQPDSYWGKMLSARSHEVAGQYDQALVVYNEVSKMYPQHAGVHLAMGKVHSELQHWQAAVDEYKEELVLDPRNPSVWALLGHAYTQARMPEQAVPILEGVLKRDRKSYAAYSDLGKCLEMQRATIKAIDAYKHSLFYGPAQNELHYRLFRLYRQIGDSSEAERQLKAFKAGEASQHERDKETMNNSLNQ